MKQSSGLDSSAIIAKMWDNLSQPLISAVSPLATQWPSAVDTAHTVTFWAAQWVAEDDVQLLADGTIRLNSAWDYFLRLRTEFGRAWTGWVAIMHFRTTLDWTQIWQTTTLKLESSSVVIALDVYVPASTPAWDLKLEIIRDFNWVNEGHLESNNPSTSWWTDSPCASFQIYKADQLI